MELCKYLKLKEFSTSSEIIQNFQVYFPLCFILCQEWKRLFNCLD